MIKTLGDRMKNYEKIGFLTLNPAQPYIARIDGHKFSTFTRGFKKPWDNLLHEAMISTTMDLVNHFKARTGYTQSDEISLVFVPTYDEKNYEYSPIMYKGRVIKLVSLMAGYASSRFNYHLHQNLITLLNKEENNNTETSYSQSVMDRIMNHMAYFDARIFNVPSDIEVFNYLYWRSKYDCGRNSISTLAQTKFSARMLHKKNSAEKLAMLQSIGINYEEYSIKFRLGTFTKREKVNIKMPNPINPSEEIEVIRTRDRSFNLDISQHDRKSLLELILAKYYYDI